MFLQYRNPYTEPAEITDTIKLAFRRRQYTNRDEARFIFSLQNYRHRRNSNSQKRPEQGWAQMQVFFYENAFTYVFCFIVNVYYVYAFIY